MGKLLKIKIDDKEIESAIIKSSFNNLKKSEEKFGFDEAPPDDATNKKRKFFNLGPSNEWKKLLSDDTKEKIEEKFKNEMKELGYL